MSESRVAGLKRMLRDILKRIAGRAGNAEEGGKGSPNANDSLAALEKRQKNIEAQLAKIK